MQKRAQTGGEIGMNGDFYQGGEFLPNTQLMSKGKSKAEIKAATRKQNVEAYKWEVAPVAGLIAIYPMLAGNYGKYDRNTNTFEIFAPYVANLGAAEQTKAADLISRYNAGERWI